MGREWPRVNASVMSMTRCFVPQRLLDTKARYWSLDGICSRILSASLSCLSE